MRKRFFVIIGCSILMLCACGNNTPAGNNTTEEITTIESVQEAEPEKIEATENETEVVNDTEVETIAETEETLEASESVVSGPQKETPVEQKTYSVEDRDGDGYADLGPTTEFNGLLMPTEQVTVDTAKLDQAVCNAGYYNPVRWNNGCTYMIVPYGEFDKGVEYLINYATQNQIPLNSFGGGNWDLMGLAEFVYLD